MLKNTSDKLEDKRHPQDKSACSKIACGCLHPALTKKGGGGKEERKKIPSPSSVCIAAIKLSQITITIAWVRIIQ